MSYEKRYVEHCMTFGLDGFGEGWTLVRRKRRRKGKQDLEIGGGVEGSGGGQGGLLGVAREAGARGGCSCTRSSSFLLGFFCFVLWWL